MDPVFTEALFTIAKTWKQPKRPLADEWIQKMWYICTMGYYSVIKKEQKNTICKNLDEPRDYHTKRKNTIRYTLYVESQI